MREIAKDLGFDRIVKDKNHLSFYRIFEDGSEKMMQFELNDIYNMVDEYIADNRHLYVDDNVKIPKAKDLMIEPLDLLLIFNPKDLAYRLYKGFLSTAILSQDIPMEEDFFNKFKVNQ